MTRDLLLHHELNKLVIINTPIAVLVGLADHLVNLVIGKLLTDGGHDVTELGSGDEAVVVAIEHLEGLTDLLLGVGILHLPGHHGKELREVDGAVVVGVDLVNHVLKLRLGGVLAQRAHDGTELLGGDLAITVLVKEGEGLLELRDLLFSKGIRHLDRIRGG